MNIKVRAECVVIDAICITIICLIVLWSRIAGLIEPWHACQIHSKVATATGLCDVEVVLDGAAQQVRVVEIVWTHRV